MQSAPQVMAKYLIVNENDLMKNLKNKRLIPTRSITTDPDRFQHRKALDPHHISELRTLIRRGTQLDPLIVWRDPKTDKLVLIEGHHRLEALRLERKTKASTRELMGNEDLAAITAVGSNRKLNLQMTPEERGEAAWSLVRRTGKDGEPAFTKPQIAEAAGVSQRQVGYMRKTLRDLKDAQETTEISWAQAKCRESDKTFFELSEDDLEAWIDEQAGLLDGKIGNEITKAYKQTPEALARVLANRLGPQGTGLIRGRAEQYMPWVEEEEDEDADY